MRFAGFASSQKRLNARVMVFSQQHVGIAGGKHGAGFRIEKHRIVADGENAGQFMGDHHDRRTETVPQLQNQIIQPLGADRVETG